MKYKKTQSSFLILIVILASALILSIIALSMPSVKLLPGLRDKEQQEEARWQHTADIYQIDWPYVGGGKQDEIGFTVTVGDGVIKDVAVDVRTTTKTSQELQTQFGQELPKYVIGKKLSEIADLDVISGASGTTKNFKDAIAALEQQLN